MLRAAAWGALLLIALSSPGAERRDWVCYGKGASNCGIRPRFALSHRWR